MQNVVIVSENPTCYKDLPERAIFKALDTGSWWIKTSPHNCVSLQDGSECNFTPHVPVESLGNRILTIQKG
jgi:hypothetical protein